MRLLTKNTKNLTIILLLLYTFAVTEGRIVKIIDRTLDHGDSISNSITFKTVEDAVIGDTDPTLQIIQGGTIPQNLTILFYRTDYSDCFQNVTTSSGTVDRCGSLDNYKSVCADTPDNKCCHRGLGLSELITNSDFDINATYNLDIKASGQYILEYLNCEKEQISISAVITYENPFGQLSAEVYPLLWFFGILTGFMVIFLLIWIVMIIIHRQHLISLQFILLILLTFELFESFSWFLLFVVINSTGTIYWLWLLIVVLLSSVKRTFVGLLLLLISLGYGIMNKSKIHDNRRLIIFVIGFYFFVSTAQELVTSFLREGVVDDQAQQIFLSFVSLVLLFPAVLIPLGLFWWICSCLIKTIQKLKLRKQEVKLELYSRLFLSLIVAGIVTCLVILLQTSISVIDTDTVWSVWWLFTAYWFLLFLFLTLVLLYLLRPSVNKVLFAYTKHDLASDDEFDASGGDMEMTDIDTLNFDFDLGLDNLEEEVSKIS